MDYYSQLEYDEKVERDYRASFNVAPSQKLPVATYERVEEMTWGLIPVWSKEFKPSFTTINARAETLAEKPLYRAPFKTRRALIPATGFFEWRKLGMADKQPFYFRLPDRELFSFAGLYDIWRDPAGEAHMSYTIITTAPNETMDGIHDRMPVILDKSEEVHWLNPESKPEELQLLLNPYVGVMERYEVDKAVGNVRNNHAGLINSL